MLFASVLIPKFSLQAALREHALSADNANFPAYDPPAAPQGAQTTAPRENPAGLIDEREKKPVILELNRAAESAGVVAGMTPSQALARCADLLILPRALKQELVVQEILLQQAFTLSPYVEETALGLCTVQFFDRRDRTGEVSRVLRELVSCRILASAGIGPNADISYLAAHRAQPLLVVDDSREFLAPLPLEVLLSNFADARSA